MKAYIINLEERKDKRKFMVDQMKNIGIDFEIFKAYEPDSIPCHIKEIIEKKNKRMTPAEIACYASHIGTMLKILDTDQDMVLILEDDALILQDFWKNIEKIERVIKAHGIDRLNLRHRKRACAMKTIFVNHHVKIIKPWAPSLSGAAYVITRAGITKFLDYIQKNPEIHPLDFEFRNLFWKGELKTWEMKGAKSNIFDSDIDRKNKQIKRQKIKWIKRSEIMKNSIKIYGIRKSVKCIIIFLFHTYRKKLKMKFGKK